MLRICFVTGTRAEFGLMQSVLAAIRADRRLKLHVVATGMHLDSSRGRTADEFHPDAIVPWKGDSLAGATGNAIAGLSSAFDRLQTDVVLIVGDRVEAFAGATAASLTGRVVAHVHGGDRAQGQVDDSLRHAITKLAHVHFPATKESAQRIARLGEEKWRIHQVGSPGIDGIRQSAASVSEIHKFLPNITKHHYALLVLHPIDSDERLENRRATDVLKATVHSGVPQVVAIHPNNDPGSAGIIRAWTDSKHAANFTSLKNVPRPIFLGLLRDAGLLIGNSSAGIIEAPSFGTPVIDVGDRQLGRQRRPDVQHVSYNPAEIARTVQKIWNNARPRRLSTRNPYGGGNTGAKIAHILGRLKINQTLLRKLIAY